MFCDDNVPSSDDAHLMSSFKQNLVVSFHFRNQTHNFFVELRNLSRFSVFCSFSASYVSHFVALREQTRHAQSVCDIEHELPHELIQMENSNEGGSREIAPFLPTIASFLIELNVKRIFFSDPSVILCTY